jgi:hypothetical protein
MSGLEHDLQTMAAMQFSVFAFAVGAFALYFFYLIWRNFHRARMIADTPTAKVRSAPQGYIELEGKARCFPDQPVFAPLTATACVWYRFKIEREKHGSRSGSRWSEIDSGRSDTPFIFFDETGECLVDPRHAEVTPVVKKVWYGSSKWPAVPERKGLFSELVGTRYRYTEERIEAGDVYLIGWFDTLRSTDTPLKQELAGRLKIWKRDQAELLRRFDNNGDGRIDADEWQQVRRTARNELVQDRAARSAQAATNVVRHSGHDRYPFLISARPQQLLGERYRRHALFALIGSVATAGLLAWMLTVRY